ncbi:MAG: hypothetical protein A2511_00880 [Deltaproteobacteria bacterium RIFOXYD12_FULL_50_9]|nr:MAG: hypothetical protein A2511_00880 [Deltaproteobacteria bacterium RIFOXYD12_FULL_50_9]
MATKQRTENTLQISISQLLADKLLVLGATKKCELQWLHGFFKYTVGICTVIVDTRDPDHASLELQFSVNGKDKIKDISLVATYPPFGGIRWWFLCPHCGKKKTHLYFSFVNPGKIACRQCENLTYRSCQTSHFNDGSFQRLMADSFIDGGIPRKRALKIVRDDSLVVGKMHREANYLGG